VSIRISQQQLESYLWGAATLLRGTIDAGDYKQFIFPLLFYKRLCDVFDEETQAALRESGGDKEFAAYPENHRFQIPQDAHWRKARQVAKNVGQVLQASMRAIETANPDKLYGIFGDAQWTNKDRLSDTMLRDLVEHFSALDLTIANLPEDELGQGYEYLIKKFADDSGHTAAEFYTNRTVVHLMTEMLQPEPGESIYDPTCGSGGMLLSCITHLRRQGKEWRNVRLFGQERNLMTSSIARMNCFLHGIEDFQIVRGDTLSEPKFVQHDRLMRFDVVLANPPYSIKQWDRQAFASDPWGRNLYGTPPQGRADYAFWQHILCSLAPKTGRCAILFPHGVLFRQEEAEMRRKIIETDLIESILGLGPNLFYNAAMEACVVVCRSAKPRERKGKILLINAVNEVTRERTQSFLTNEHIERIVNAYYSFTDQPGFAKVAGLDVVRGSSHSLKIDLYVPTPCASNGNGIVLGQRSDLQTAVADWSDARTEARSALTPLLPDVTSAGQQLEDLQSVPGGCSRAFDRENWPTVRFGDLVKYIKDNVDPNSGELSRYVAGNHMDSDDVHIRRWGTVGDGYLGPAFIRRFRKGQVLYGSRRTYLKKVAFTEFDGITANTTFVLEGVEGKLYQPLLPWLMLSRKFTEHSVRESKGSTNPYINFPDIEKFEFGLPPLKEQRRISDILWTADREEQQKAELAVNTLGLLRSEVERELEKLFGNSCDQLSRLLLRSPESGSSAPPSATDTGHFVLSLTALSRIGYVRGNLKPVASTKPMLDCRLVYGDFLVSRSNTQELVGFVGIFDEDRDDVSFPDTMMRLQVDETRVLKRFLEAVLQSRRGRLHMMRSAAGTSGSMKKINRRTLGTCLIPTPALKVQEQFIGRVQQVRGVGDAVLTCRDAARTLKLSLLESLTGL